ncbi:MAG: hypothetical protein ACR2O4_04895 [Hyphomicrobiaceae bacterium]
MRTDNTRVHQQPGHALMTLAAVLVLGGTAMHVSAATGTSNVTTPITQRHVGITREQAAEMPDREADQALVDGWPLYRTERGQEAFNHAMAALRATEGDAPSASAFAKCSNLNCRLLLPKLTSRGWIPSGRIWVSPSDYVLIVHSPRRAGRKSDRRRSRKRMRYFVFHEFHNSTRNTDVYDTISAHRRSVFVPFYLGKPGIDATGRRFVVVVQVAPHNIVSRHAGNFGHAGPGIEVAKNRWEKLAQLQAQAGVLVATIVKAAEPQLRVVRHRGAEGRPMLRAYQRRLAVLKAKSRRPKVRLPFTPASKAQVARATGAITDVIRFDGVASAPKRFRIPVPKLAMAPLPKFRVPVPQPAVAPPRPEPVRATPLTMEALIRRILSEPFGGSLTD